MDRKRATSRTTVVAGSVWETRMMNDEIMGGFKVFNATGDKNPEVENSQEKPRTPKQSPFAKRKTWKSDESIQIGVSVAKKSPNSKVKEVSARNPVRIRKLKPKSIDLDEGDEIEKSPVHKMNLGSDEDKEITERNPAHIGKLKLKTLEFSGGIEKNLAQLREVKSESVNVIDESEIYSNPLPKKDLKELRSTSIGSKIKILELKRSVDESIDEIEKIGSKSGEEKPISNELVNIVPIKSVSESDHNDVALISNVDDLDDKIVVEEEEQSIEGMKPLEQKPKKIVNNEKKFNQIKEKPSPISQIVKKQSSNLVNYSRTNPSPAKSKTVPEFDRFQSRSIPQRDPQTHGKLQSLIDLVMWRDVSRSAFIFGIGTFIIISSSYTKDLNFSFISVFSYMGLVYLAAIFIFRSIISRGIVDRDETSEEYVVGEDEAVWLLKMVLPYLNELLIKIRALFSGDPATTMKLAVLLFVLARCGSSITIWKMAKLGFFGMFTMPKICSSYSTQLTAYGKFWVRRFHDAWESCTHKKAVGFGIFTLVWNLSSVIARIWAVFMLFVVFRYYQQSMVTDDDCAVEEELKCVPPWQGRAGGRRLRRGPTNMATSTKENKKL